MPPIRRAEQADLPALLPLIQEFCLIDGHEYDEDRVVAALAPLLEDDQLGQVWVVDTDAGDLGGYAVVTWGYSIESGGRDALLDELYVRDRDRGVGGRCMDAAIAAARRAGATRMFLETEAANDTVRRFYRRHGFLDETSIWMQRDL